MKVRHLFITAVLAGLPLFGSAASAATIEVIETFDYPGVGQLTEPQKINNRGDIVGTVIDAATGVAKGFYRDRKGHFSSAFTEPNDTAGVTQARGINDSRVICGNYDIVDGTIHGFFLPHRVFIGFDVPDSSSTLVLGINNAGDFAGSVVAPDGVTQSGFVSLDGTITSFDVPDAAATLAYQVNASNQTAGFYFDTDSVTHGYLRASDGTLTYPIDPEGSTGTILFGNNDSNWVVGRYADAEGISHASSSSRRTSLSVTTIPERSLPPLTGSMIRAISPAAMSILLGSNTASSRRSTSTVIVNHRMLCPRR